MAERGGKLGRVAVSECLLGSPVRWDGDHNGAVWPRQRAERLFDLVGLCPEVGIGMGVPREPIQLVGDSRGPWRAVAVADPGKDYTARLQGYTKRMAATLDGVSGYIFADRSPSCGLAGVKAFSEDGSFRRVGRGIYASAVLAAHPGLPAVDAETLADEEALLEFASAVLRFRRGDADETGVRERVRQLLE